MTRQIWKIRLWLARIIDVLQSALYEWRTERVVKAGASCDPRYVIMLSQLPVIKQHEVLERVGVICAVRTALSDRIFSGQMV